MLLHPCAFGPTDLKHDFTLSDEFRRNHYLTGLLLHELKMAMSEPRDVRRCAITVLRNQLAKHSFDDRYASKVGRTTQAWLRGCLVCVARNSVTGISFGVLFVWQ